MRAAILLVVAGCLRTTAYPCSTSADCVLGGAQGICQTLAGFCSFGDGTCPSGQRFGDLSGSYANQCVAPVGGVDAGIDAPRPIDASPDTPAAAPFCDANGEPTLVGCWEFENDLVDHSGDGNDGTGTLVTFLPGKVGLAASVDPSTTTPGHISVPDSASLTPTAITIEGWVKPNTIPVAGRMGIFDNDGQYGLFINAGGALHCTVNVTLDSGATVLVAGVWTHVACAYDGANGALYIDGVLVNSATGGTPLGAGNTNGGAIAGNSPSLDTLDGLIDQLRIWNVARTPAQICQAAGVPGC
jgi:hypothetical protein